MVTSRAWRGTTMSKRWDATLALSTHYPSTLRPESLSSAGTRLVTQDLESCNGYHWLLGASFLDPYHQREPKSPSAPRYIWSNSLVLPSKGRCYVWQIGGTEKMANCHKWMKEGSSIVFFLGRACCFHFRDNKVNVQLRTGYSGFGNNNHCSLF